MHQISEEGFGKILVFTNTKRFVDNLARALSGNGWPAQGIHGDKTQNQRDYIIQKFKRANKSILVATDVAARGLGNNNYYLYTRSLFCHALILLFLFLKLPTSEYINLQTHYFTSSPCFRIYSKLYFVSFSRCRWHYSRDKLRLSKHD